MAITLDTILGPDTPVLIVDDNPQYTMVLRKTLGAFGYLKIQNAESPSEGYTLLKGPAQDSKLLFIDFRFPSGTNGCEFLKQLQSEGLLNGRIAFLITSEPTVENMKAATAAGAIGVVAKPFDREELKRQLEKAERLVKSLSQDSF